jgi:molybdopterin-guanine dinucleotide biosynthesis protein A
VIGVVLTGGASSRMGRDKALIEVGGTAMAVRVAGALRAGGCDPVWCQGGDVEALAALGLVAVPDPAPRGGPLPAIAAALAAAGDEPILVAACDLVDLDAASVTSLIEAHRRQPDARVVVGADLDGTHLLSIWSPNVAVDLAALVSKGLASYRAALERLGAAQVGVDRRAVRNVNTPGDLAGPG